MSSNDSKDTPIGLRNDRRRDLRGGSQRDATGPDRGFGRGLERDSDVGEAGTNDETVNFTICSEGGPAGLRAAHSKLDQIYKQYGGEGVIIETRVSYYMSQSQAEGSPTFTPVPVTESTPEELAVFERAKQAMEAINSLPPLRRPPLSRLPRDPGHCEIVEDKTSVGSGRSGQSAHPLTGPRSDGDAGATTVSELNSPVPTGPRNNTNTNNKSRGGNGPHGGRGRGRGWGDHHRGGGDRVGKPPSNRDHRNNRGGRYMGGGNRGMGGGGRGGRGGGGGGGSGRTNDYRNGPGGGRYNA